MKLTFINTCRKGETAELLSRVLDKHGNETYRVLCHSDNKEWEFTPDCFSTEPYVRIEHTDENVGVYLAVEGKNYSHYLRKDAFDRLSKEFITNSVAGKVAKAVAQHYEKQINAAPSHRE